MANTEDKANENTEISFILKLIRMREAAARRGDYRSIQVSQTAQWLKRHILVNGYTKRAQAKSFFDRHTGEIETLLFKDKPKLTKEFEALCQRKPQ